MTLIRALEKLKSVGLPVIRTADAAALLGVQAGNASAILARLARNGILERVKRGLWAWAGTDPLVVVPFVTAPLPGYVSLQTALYLHGMISQIPEMVFCVSPARTRRYPLRHGTLSVHHVPPGWYFGYEMNRDGSFGLATPEKALADLLYLGTARSRLFAALPELEFPAQFSRRRLAAMLARIPDRKRRTYAQKRFQDLL